MLQKLQKLAIASTGVVSSAFTAAAVFAQSKTADSAGSKALGEPISPGTGWAENFGSLINSVLTIVMVIALLLVLLYLILGGIEWITSGGDKGKTESARNKITAAVIGIIILAAAYALVTLVAWILGFEGGIGGAFDQIERISN